jgi:hypothetical protein
MNYGGIRDTRICVLRHEALSTDAGRKDTQCDPIPKPEWGVLQGAVDSLLGNAFLHHAPI